MPGARTAGPEEPATFLPQGKGERILVVDDEPGIRQMMQVALEQQGYSVLTAGDGTEAVAVLMARRELVHLLITDLMMPIMDGMSLVRTLQKLTPQTKVLVSSGLESGAGKIHATATLRSLGVKAFLMKPYETRDLLKAVYDALHN